MRYLKSITAGILFWVAALDLGWHLTDVDFLELLVVTSVFYLAGFFLTWTRMAPEPEPKRTRREPQIYTLSREDYCK